MYQTIAFPANYVRRNVHLVSYRMHISQMFWNIRTAFSVENVLRYVQKKQLDIPVSDIVTDNSTNFAIMRISKRK
jgi:hypothetical protein